MRYDVVVAGLGAMGSAAAYQLAQSGVSVLGLDRYQPPHTLGSTHGDTRITRVAVGEGLEYVPLVRRRTRSGARSRSETGAEILSQCGGLVMAPPLASFAMHGSESFLEHTVAAAEAYDLEHERLNTAEWPLASPSSPSPVTSRGCYEPGAGFVRPEAAVEAQLRLARERGATLAFGERVVGYDDHGTHVTVRTTNQTVEASTLVVTAGPWVSELVPELAPVVRILRQVLFWFDLRDASSYPGLRDSPVYIWSPGTDPDEVIYGFPMVDGPDGGAKVAREQFVVDTTPDDVDRAVSPDEIEEMYERYVRDRLPALSGRCVKAAVCLYTDTPDSRFVIDRLPSMPNVIVASPCSGHGFKHSAAIGECLAQLATQGREHHRSGPVRPGRPLKPTAAARTSHASSGHLSVHLRSPVRARRTQPMSGRRIGGRANLRLHGPEWRSRIDAGPCACPFLGARGPDRFTDGGRALPPHAVLRSFVRGSPAGARSRTKTSAHCRCPVAAHAEAWTSLSPMDAGGPRRLRLRETFRNLVCREHPPKSHPWRARSSCRREPHRTRQGSRRCHARLAVGRFVLIGL